MISDLTGKVMLIDKISLSETKQTVETSMLGQGVYNVQLKDGKSILKSIPLVVIR